MSATTALDTGAIQSGIAWPARPHERPASRWGQAERRGRTPAQVISREYDQLCTQACDPLEIAAGLEAAGLDDHRARSEYQAAGVFELAEQLWRMVPWRPAPERPSANHWWLPLWRAQLRGLLYALPAVLVTAAVPRMSDAAGSAFLLAVTATSVGLGQALSVLGHLLAGREQHGSLRRLEVGAVTAAVAVTAVVAIGTWAGGGPVRLCLVACGQLTFAISATVLMVQNREGLLLALVGSGVLLTATATLGAHQGGLSGEAYATAVSGTSAVTVLTVTVLMVAVAACLPGPAAAGDEPLRLAVGASELTAARTAGWYGLGLSLAVSAPAIATAADRVHHLGAWLMLASLPMTTTFGTAEYLLHRARGRAASGLGRARTVRGFAQGLRRELRLMMGLQAVTVGVVAAAVVLAGQGRDGAGGLAGVTVEFALLAPVLLLLTALMSMGYLTLAAQLAWAGAAALLLPLAVPALHDVALLCCEAGVAVVLLTSIYRVVSTRFCTVTAHR
jgi:hypothetical protein